MPMRPPRPSPGHAIRDALLVALLALVVPFAAAGAQVGPAPVFAGIVVDSASGAGVAGAEVTIRGQRAITDAQGQFRLYVPRTTVDTVRIRRLGFRGKVRVVGSAEDPLALRIPLASIPQQLSPVVVEAEFGGFSGRLAGYYRRLATRTTGQFVTREELDREQTGLLTNVLQRLPGIHVRRGPGAPTLTMRGRNCYPLVWLDGIAMPAGTVDLDSFSPTSLHGVELYLGAMSVPHRFQASRGQSECGTIVLWSRGPDTDPVGGRTSVKPEELERLIAAGGLYTADEVDQIAVAKPGTDAVAYPQSMRAANVSGSVVAEFIVDTSGHVEPGSSGIVSATNTAFAEEVLRMLSSAAYTPAKRRGMVVRQLVRQRFVFGEPATP